MAEDYYTLLGVAKDASAAEIKKAYKSMAMKHHPDRTSGDQQSEKKFKQINEAYSVLSDSEQRARYDQFGHAGVNNQAGGFNPGEAGFGDAFSDIFGDIFGGGQRVRRGRDLQYATEISLEEAVRGSKKTVRLTKGKTCGDCQGTGAKDGTSFHQCKVCNGRGKVRVQQSFFTIEQACPECAGSGKTIDQPCRTCSGRGAVRASKTLSINIPAGVEDGDRMRLSGEGEASPPGGQPGDLYVDIRVMPHPIFTRDGTNLFCQIPVSFATLALGGEVQVPTLSGKVSLKVPEGTQNSKAFRLRSKGIKNLRSSQVGDLLCKLEAEVPVKLTQAQKDALRQFDASVQSGGGRHSPHTSGWVHKVKRFFDSLG